MCLLKIIYCEFPIRFAKPRGDYDFVSPFINVIGNGSVVAVAGVGAITYVALKELGFTKAAAILTTIPVGIGAIGATGVLVGIFSLGFLTYAFLNIR